MKKTILILFNLLSLFLLSACNGNSSGTTPGSGSGSSSSASCTDVESRMTTLLNSTTTTDNLPFTYLVERLSDGRQFSYSKSGSAPSTSYESASTSKWVSGVIIYRAVENGNLALTDKPQSYLGAWPITSGDTLYNLTLSDLLSFTSGLTSEPLCLNSTTFNFSTCVNNVGTSNANNGIVPNNEFYYASTHLQVAGKMVIQSKSVSDWQAVFTEFKTQTGLFSSSTYDLPSSTNPRLAGGMHWNATEYLGFLRKLAKGQLLNSSSMNTYLLDHTANATMTYSPVKSSTLNEEWHYGYGYWHECQNPSWNCNAASRISSPGAYGSYPFWDRANNYIGIVARQGTTGTFPYGVQIERAVRSLTKEWLTCN